MARAVGVDLGSHAVRAAQVRLGDPPEVVAFGQVGIPRGVIEHGEVVDPGAVAGALRRLWSEAGIRDRRVRVGMANLRTIVRQVELPEMAPDELRSALEFQAGDFIPLPPEDTHLDFHVLETFTREGETEGEVEPMMRVLIAAVHRDVLDNALLAVREAGLQAVGVDLVPFALVRSLGSAGPRADGGTGQPGETGDTGDTADTAEGEGAGEADASPGTPAVRAGTEAIVSVGSGVTVVVIHEHGVPRFVRIVDTGGDDVTDGVGEALDVDLEEAELLKRQVDEGGDRAAETRAAMEGPTASIVDDVRGSIDFYISQLGARPVGRTLVTGGGALTSGLFDRLRDALDGPVELADPRDTIAIGDVGFDAEELTLLLPYLPVPVGLALGGDKAAPYRINLLPSGQARVVPTARLLALGAGALAIVLVGLAVLTMQRNDELADVRSALEEQQAVNRSLQSEIDQLSDARALQGEVDASQGRVADLLGADVSWSRLLSEVARVIPTDVWLNDFNGNASRGEGGLEGNVTFSAAGTDFPSVAAWLQRVATLPSFANAWVSEASRGTATFGSAEVDTVNFSGSVELTPEAISERARQAGVTVEDQTPQAAPPSDGGASPGTGEEGTP